MSTTAEDSTHDGVGPGTFLRARHDLAAAIRRGDYPPNHRLVESELAAALGVSRPTLRSVFIALEQENYISLEHNRGARVRQFSPEEAVDILDTRVILESAAAGLAAAHITPEECDQLDEFLDQMMRADVEGDGEAYRTCYREFHMLLIAAARQPLLSKFIAATPYPLVMKQFRSTNVRHPRPGSLREHQALLAALRIGNSVAAEAIMRAHIMKARDALALG